MKKCLHQTSDWCSTQAQPKPRPLNSYVINKNCRLGEKLHLLKSIQCESATQIHKTQMPSWPVVDMNETMNNQMESGELFSAGMAFHVSHVVTPLHNDR